MTTLDIARDFQVSGQVRNVVDGTVELIAEGEAVELVAFLDAVAKRFQRNITNKNEDWQAISAPKHTGFRIADTGH